MILPLTLQKQKSFLDGLNLLEINSKNVIDALLKSNNLMKHWDDRNYSNQQAKQNYTNEIEQIKEYRKKLKNKTICVVHKKPKHGWGRPYIVKSLGFTSFRQKVRNTLMNNKYYDFDIKNAQIEILRCICKSNNVKTPNLDYYVANREEVLELVMKTYNVNRSSAKKLFLRLAFKGTFKGWLEDEVLVKKNDALMKSKDEEVNNNTDNLMKSDEIVDNNDVDNNDENNDKNVVVELNDTVMSNNDVEVKNDGVNNIYERIDFIDKLEGELETIAFFFKQHNPELYETARKSKMAKGEKNYIGSFFSLYLQEYECRIVEEVMRWLINETTITKKKGIDGEILTYEYDGIKLLKTNVNKYGGGKDELLKYLNHKTEDLTGFKLEWIEKPIENLYDLKDEIEEMEDENEEPKQTGEFDFELDILRNEIDDIILHNQKGIAEIVNKLAPKHFLCTFGEWKCWNGKKWENSVSPLKKFIMYDVQAYLKNKIEPYIKKYEKIENENVNYKNFISIKEGINSIIKYKLCNNAEINAIVSIAENIMCDDTITFDSNIDLLGFDNCVYDISNDKLRPYRFDDYVTMSCGYAMEDLRIGKNTRTITVEDAMRFYTIRKIINQILPDKDIRMLVLLILASGLSGKCIEKFFVFNGEGGNGKSYLNEFQTFALGDYSYLGHISLLTYKSKDTKGANPELAGMHKKRYVYFKEPEEGRKLENSNIKDLTGGGLTKARMCYSNRTTVELNNTTVEECNERPLLKETPTKADIRRITDILFSSTFTENAEEVDEKKHIYKADPTLKDISFKEKHRVYFMNILMEHIQILKENNYTFDKFIPEAVKERSNAYLQSCCEIHNLFIQLYEPANYEKTLPESKKPFISINDVSRRLRTLEDYNLLPKIRKAEFKNENIKKFFSTNKMYAKDYREVLNYYDSEGNRGKTRNALIGWKEREDNEDDV